MGDPEGYLSEIGQNTQLTLDRFESDAISVGLALMGSKLT